jgi:hypothetical protein
MAIPINKTAGPDNPNPVIHHVVQGHDIDIGSNTLTIAKDYLGIDIQGDCHTHMDALCHVAYKGCVYKGRPADAVITSQGATALDVRSGLRCARSLGLRFAPLAFREPGVRSPSCQTSVQAERAFVT